MHSSARSIKHSSFVIERRFDYDPSQVYRAWVEPSVKARWFAGPADKWAEEVREMDVRVGGRDRLIGKFTDGSESRFEAQYFEVVQDRRLVYTYDMYWQGKKISVSLAARSELTCTCAQAQSWSAGGNFVAADSTWM